MAPKKSIAEVKQEEEKKYVKKQYKLSTYIWIWCILSFPIVVWDALYILYRPRSMKGGDLEFIWVPYQTYIQADGRYGDVNDGFGISQSYLNLFELLLQAIAMVLGAAGRNSAILFMFASAILTAAKTAIYFLTEVCSGPNGFEYTGHSLASGDLFTFWITFVLPSSFWLIIPTIITYTTGKQILHALNTSFHHSTYTNTKKN